MRNIPTGKLSITGLSALANEDSSVEFHSSEYKRKLGRGGDPFIDESRSKAFHQEAAQHLDYLSDSDSPVYRQPYTPMGSIPTKQSPRDTGRGMTLN